jgi:glutamine synthetase
MASARPARQVEVQDTPELRERIAEAGARLRAAGVQYVFGSWVDVHGRSKAKAVPLEHFDRLVRGSELYTVGALDGMGPLGPNEDECCALPALESLTVCPWDHRYAWMASDLWLHGEHYPYDSRWVLERVLDRARDAGYVCKLGIEPEFYVLREDGDGGLLPYHPNDRGECWGYDVESLLDAMSFIDRMARCLDELGWGLYSFDHEGGNSQYELDFGYADALTMADRFVFLRLMLKEVAKQCGAFVTFMPKPFSDNFGSGAHHNMSLADPATGANLFDDGGDYSDLTRHFVGGLLEHAGAITALTCPTVNSYKRLVGQGYMPMVSWAPAYAHYGDNNRSCMIRLPGNRRCVENRAADVSGNVYLGAALSLAAGLQGVERGTDPGESATESLYELERSGAGVVRRLPRDLREAVAAFEADPLAADVLGPLAPEYAALKRREWEQYHQTVSRWELDRYLRFF